MSGVKRCAGASPSSARVVPETHIAAARPALRNVALRRLGLTVRASISHGTLHGHKSQPPPVVTQVSSAWHWAAGHCRFVPQLFVPLQITSQLHEALQSTPPLQASSAVQSTEHLPGPHRIVVAQALDAQLTSHADDGEQFTPLLHAPVPHVTLHGPAPQRMGNVDPRIRRASSSARCSGSTKFGRQTGRPRGAPGNL